MLEVLQRSSSDCESDWLLRASHHGAGTVRVAPFDAVELALGDLWIPKHEP